MFNPLKDSLKIVIRYGAIKKNDAKEKLLQFYFWFGPTQNNDYRCGIIIMKCLWKFYGFVLDILSVPVT